MSTASHDDITVASTDVIPAGANQQSTVSAVEETSSSSSSAAFSHSIDKNGDTKTTGGSSIQANRTNMAILHFLMTSPKWSIGLFLFLAARSSPIQTPDNAIYKPITQLRTLVEMEGRSYRQCVDRSWKQAQRQLEQVAVSDRQRLQELHEGNQMAVQRAQEQTNACLRWTQKARDSLVRWREDGMDLPWTSNEHQDDAPTTTTLNSTTATTYNPRPTCSAEDQERMETLLGQDFRLVEDQVATTLDDYVKDSEQSMELIHTYAMARFEYDYNYFVGNRIQPALDYLASQRAKIERYAVSFDVKLSDVERRIRATLDELEVALEQAKEHIDVLQEKLEEFAESLVDFYEAYTEVFARLERAANFVYDLLPPGIRLPSFLNLLDLPVVDSLMPPSLSWPTLTLDYQEISALLEEAANECLLILQDIVEDVRGQAFQQLQDAIREISDGLEGILELKDYNPPQFQGSIDGIVSMAQELNFQTFRGQQAKNWTLQSMASLQNQVSKLEFNSTNAQGPNISNIDYSYVEESTQFGYLGMLFPDISIPDLLRKMAAWVSLNIWIMEILIQAYRLWRLESIYARGAIPHLPEIDYGDGDEQIDNSKMKYMILKMILKSFLTPRILLIAVFLPIFIVAIAFWFPHVHQSCVQTREGTFLANNFLSPLLINHANALGNVQFLHMEFQCQQNQRQWCTEVGAEAEAQYRTDLTALHTLHAQHNQSIEALSLMENCIDSLQLTGLMREACCGLKGYGSVGCLADTNLTCPIDYSTDPHSAFLPFKTYLEEPTCQDWVSEWTLEESRYDCSNLVEVCSHIPCAGVSEDFIHRQTVESDCKVELYAIDFCFFLLSLFFHAIAINVISTLLFNGFRQLQWRKLCPNGIRLKTNLRENGELAKGFEIQDRSDQIAKAVWHFELIGKMQIGLGVILFLTYMVFTLVLIAK